MGIKYFAGLLVTATFLQTLNAPATAADAQRGAEIYESRCGACHSIEKNRVGPRHLNVFGRTAGSQDGYVYSRALAQADFRWDEVSLDRWLANPQALVPGQKMGYRLRKAEDRADIIAFFKRLAGQAGNSAPENPGGTSTESGGD